MAYLAGAYMLESREAKHQPGSHRGQTHSGYGTNLELIHWNREVTRE